MTGGSFCCDASYAHVPEMIAWIEKMSPTTKFTRPPDPWGLEHEIRTELTKLPWAKPFQRSLEDLGASMGSNIGSRRARNEDRLAVAQIVSAVEEPFTVAIVCDGVGGSEMGDAAATLAISIFLAELASLRERRALSLLIVDLIRKVDDGVRAELNGRGATTLCAILTSTNGQFAAANVGDSRLFSWRPNGSAIEQVSVDDTLENELRALQIKDASVLEARGLRGSLSQAIGESGRTSASLKVQTFARDRFKNGIVLATDGTWKVVEEAFKVIAKNSPTALDMVRRSLAFAGWAGGVDNASLIAVERLEDFGRMPVLNGQKDLRARVVVWACDSKTVFRELIDPAWDARPAEQIRRNNFTEKKPKRRGDPTRKEGPTTKVRGDAQLDLISDPKERVARPKIEISTDAER
jgi:serine/threonine protein phosphatase PrpC